jgi:hypothetical protein
MSITKAACFLVCLSSVLSFIFWIEANANDTPTTAGEVVEETTITGCDLFLFGRHIDPEMRNGQTGHHVVRTRRLVTINGQVFFDVDAPPPAEVVTESSLRHVEVLDRTEIAVRKQSIGPSGAENIRVDGVDHRIGEFIAFSTDADGKVVKVAYFPEHFIVKYRGIDSYASYVVAKSAAKGVDRETRLENVYRQVVQSLQPGVLLIMGKTYRISIVDPALQESARTAIASIPKKARVQPQRAPGKQVYEPLQIGDLFFGSDEVQDFVNAERERGGK